MYLSNSYYQVVKYQLTSTNGTFISALNSGQYCQQFGVDSSNKVYIPTESDRIFLYQSDMYSIYSSIISLDANYLFIGPSNKIYIAEEYGSVAVYNQSVNSGYSTYYDATEDGEYEIQVYFYDHEYDRNYEVTLGPVEPETYIEYLQRIDLEMIPYYLYDAVLARNEAQIINLFKSNRPIVSKLVNFYQKMKNAHENPRRLNTPYNYNINWYAKIRYDVSQPNIPYLVGYQDMYFMYLYLYNKTVYLNMFYLLEVAQKYYRKLLLAQRAINFNQDTTVYYNLDSSITNNYLLLNFVNSFFNVNIYPIY